MIRDVRFPILNAMKDRAPRWVRGAFDARAAVKAWDESKVNRGKTKAGTNEGSFAPKDDVGAGAMSANDQEILDLLVQDWVIDNTSAAGVILSEIAARRFGGVAANENGRIEARDVMRAIRDLKSSTPNLNGVMGEAGRLFDAQYARTQKELAKIHPDGYVELYRGVRNRKGSLKEGAQALDFSALSSWADNKEHAAMYAEEWGMVLAARVPIRQIWAAPESNDVLKGDGQGEYMVLGFGVPMEVRATAAANYLK